MTDHGLCEDCGKPSRWHLSRGRCRTCYPKHIRALKESGQYIRLGGPGTARPARDRFLDQIAPGWGGCWIWTGGTERGYGQISEGRRTLLVHRVAYQTLVGPVPPGLELDHVCHTNDKSCPGGECLHRRCCNPAHLEPVTPVENKRRGRSFSGVNAQKTHCAHGHEFTPENTRVLNDGARECRLCSPRWRAAYRERHREQIRAEGRQQREAKAAAEGRELALPVNERTHCPKGHPYDEANTVLRNGRRNCRACQRQSSRDYQARKRQQTPPRST